MTLSSEPIADPEKLSASKEKLKLWLAILKTSRSIEAEVRERLRCDFQTTLPRFDVLAALYRSPTGLKMGDLSAALKVSNGNVTGIVERLVQEGLVLRIPVEGDRRALLVCLTQKGCEHFSEQAVTHEGWIEEMLTDISLERATQLQNLLTQVEQSIENAKESKS